MQEIVDWVSKIKAKTRGIQSIETAQLSDSFLKNYHLILKNAFEAFLTIDGKMLLGVSGNVSIGTMETVTQVLSDSGDERAIVPLAILAKNMDNWLLQGIAIKALTKLGSKYPLALREMDKIDRVVPPKSDHIFEIKPNNRSPHVYLDCEKGFFIIKGKYENEPEFSFDPIYEFLGELCEFDKVHPDSPLIAAFCFDIFQYEVNLFSLYLFQRIATRTNTIVYWYYDRNDDEMLEAGKDFEAVINLPFRFIERPVNQDYNFVFYPQ